jgi:hypothetical protein
VRDGDSLSRLGKMAEVFDDFSPLQLMAQGRHGEKTFTVIGRLQYRYEGGTWTEWLCALDDGSSAWLSEDNGSFVWATPVKSSDKLPEARQWTVGRIARVGGKSYAVASAMQAALVAAQGELPRLPGLGQAFTVVELRSTTGSVQEVLTLDYSSQPPGLSRGVPVSLDTLALAGLRDPQAQGGSDRQLAGRAFNCPNCGSALEVKLAQTQSISCPSCQSVIDVSGGIGGELKHAMQDEPIQPLIALGSEGVLDGRKWQVVGYQHRSGQDPADTDETFAWEEYLLYNRKAGFVFLVDSADGWSLVKPVTGAPDQMDGTASIGLDGMKYKLLYRYVAETQYVCGEFYWQVKRGQKTINCDYSGSNKRVLSSEKSGNEVTWSAGRVLDYKEVAKAFGQAARTDLFRRADVEPLSGLGASLDAESTLGRTLGYLFVIFVLFMLVVMVPRCTRSCDPTVENCNYSSSSGGGGGSWGGGGWSGSGGHK